MTKERRLEQIIHNQLAYSISVSVATYFANNFKHYVHKAGTFKLNADLKHLNKLSREMEKTLGVKEKEELEDVVLDTEGFVYEVVEKMANSILHGKEKQFLESIKFFKK